MKRWVTSPVSSSRELPAVDAFLEEINEVCRKHGMSISHEDTHGAFIIDRLDDERDLEWLSLAHASGDLA